MTIEELTQQINQIAKEHAELEKEIVDDSLAVHSAYVVSHLETNNLCDVLLFCSASNLLNTYVKQKKPIFSYGFKKQLFHFVRSISKSTIYNLELSFQYDKQTTFLLVSIYNCQFSFHSIPPALQSLISDFYNKRIEWDGIKKQKCAKTIYELVLCWYNHQYENNQVTAEAAILKQQYESRNYAIEYFIKKCFSN